MTTNKKRFEVGKSYGVFYYSDYFDKERLAYILTVVKRTEKTLWLQCTTMTELLPATTRELIKERFKTIITLLNRLSFVTIWTSTQPMN